MTKQSKNKSCAVKISLLAIFTAAMIGCQPVAVQKPAANVPQSLREVPALRLNYRFEADVPAPTITQTAQSEEANAAVQVDFDQNRTTETLDKVIAAPDKQRVLAVYHRAGDAPLEFRLDMYAPDGKPVRKITYDGMAAHFPETIVWSPDSSAVAFVAMIRGSQTGAPSPNAAPSPTPAVLSNSDAEANLAANENVNANSEANANSDVNANSAAPAAAEEPAKPVLTFRTEQLYLCDKNGAEVKPLTQNEGLVYYYFVWSPDSSALAALAATFQEWNFLQYQATSKKEVFIPQGRPRLVEKTGRERRLDDNLTDVRPVWSPDSAKVAEAFDKQVRIYDAIGDAPTQAAIPLRNQFLISSKTFDENLRRQEQTTDNQNAANVANAAENQAVPNTNQEMTTLPDEGSLVSFNPIISLEWTADEMLYLQTGYIKLMENEADSARSYLRWHRLIFSPQPVALGQ